MRRIVTAVLLLVAAASAQTRFADDVKRYISVDAPVVALTHVRVIDGTGAAPAQDQTVVIDHGKIARVGRTAEVQPPAGATVLDRTGYTVIPGLVGMHNHLYYTAFLDRTETGGLKAPGFFLNELPFTAPRLYLACGVTTMRTTGDVEPYTDMNLKHQVDAGLMPGPKIDVTAPYLEGAPGGSMFPQMHELQGPDDARNMVNFYASQGFTSFKAYMHIKAADLKAAIDAAHAHHLKLTGHLCSIGYRQAAELGIDDLEHGFFVNSDFAASKQPDVCPPGKDIYDGLLKADANSAEMQSLFRFLVDHHVAVTSTLPVFEASTGINPVPQRVLDAMTTESRASYLASRARISPEGAARSQAMLKRDMELERAFVRAGGLLLAGPDPTGNGGTLPGFADQREIELLVQAGFTPVEAIQIATSNGAKFEGNEQIGSVAAGKVADLVLIKGDPSANINDIERVETVFKDGVGFDSQKLIDSVKGQVGLR